jgi:hypothetical protein
MPDHSNVESEEIKYFAYYSDEHNSINVNHNCPKGNIVLLEIAVPMYPVKYVCMKCGYTERDPND